jgi:hypothetical protein
MSNGGAIAATTAARIAAERMRQEEEEMTAYNKEDLDGWEFKIIRSNTGKFKKFEAVRILCQEESRAGWEMVEKFDDNRIRFKRRIENRGSDNQMQFDAYRTRVGVSDGALAFIIIGCIAALVGIVALLAVTIGK